MVEEEDREWKKKEKKKAKRAANFIALLFQPNFLLLPFLSFSFSLLSTSLFLRLPSLSFPLRSRICFWAKSGSLENRKG